MIDLRKGYTPEDLKDIKFINKDIGWVVGRKGFIWKTIDGGSSWNHLESGTNRYLYGLFTLDENRVWIVGADGAILSTKNGGVFAAPPQASRGAARPQDLNGKFSLAEGTKAIK